MLQTLKAQLEFFEQMRNTAAEMGVDFDADAVAEAASNITAADDEPGGPQPQGAPLVRQEESKPQDSERESEYEKTKIVCTIGPACDSEETLRAMMLAGMNVARLNFSHGTHAEHQVRIDRIKKLRAELDRPSPSCSTRRAPSTASARLKTGPDNMTTISFAVPGTINSVGVNEGQPSEQRTVSCKH